MTKTMKRILMVVVAVMLTATTVYAGENTFSFEEISSFIEITPPTEFVKNGTIEEIKDRNSYNCYGLALGLSGCPGLYNPGFISGSKNWDNNGNLREQVESDMKALQINYQIVPIEAFSTEMVGDNQYAFIASRTVKCPSDYNNIQAFYWKMSRLSETEDFHFTVYVPSYGWFQKNGYKLPPNNYVTEKGAIDLVRYSEEYPELADNFMQLGYYSDFAVIVTLCDDDG